MREREHMREDTGGHRREEDTGESEDTEGWRTQKGGREGT